MAQASPEIRRCDWRGRAVAYGTQEVASWSGCRRQPWLEELKRREGPCGYSTGEEKRWLTAVRVSWWFALEIFTEGTGGETQKRFSLEIH